jgi:hypothetical protein
MKSWWVRKFRRSPTSVEVHEASLTCSFPFNRTPAASCGMGKAVTGT